MFVGTVLNLYENEVEGLVLRPRWRGGVVVAIAPPWARAGLLHWHNAETKTKHAFLPTGLRLIYRRVAQPDQWHLFPNNFN
jgi:hypothetical protein